MDQLRQKLHSEFGHLIPNVISASAGPSAAERTVLALAFGTEAKRVILWLKGEGTRHLDLRVLSEGRARKARVEPFNYAVTTFVGEFCVKRLRAFTSTDREVSDSGPMPCS